MISIKKALFALSFGMGLAYALPAAAAPDADTCQAWVDECHAGDANACYQFNRLASYCHYYGIFM
jgi:hypothetical protein